MGGQQSMLNEACVRRGLRLLRIETDVKEVMLLAAGRKGLVDMGVFMHLFSWHPRLENVQDALEEAWKKADKVARSAKAAAVNEEKNTRRIPGSTAELQTLLDQLSRDTALYKSFCPKVDLQHETHGPYDSVEAQVPGCRKQERMWPSP